MYRLDRRRFIVNGIALLGAGPALAQQGGHAGHGQYEKLTEPGRWEDRTAAEATVRRAFDLYAASDDEAI